MVMGWMPRHLGGVQISASVNEVYVSSHVSFRSLFCTYFLSVDYEYSLGF